MTIQRTLFIFLLQAQAVGIARADIEADVGGTSGTYVGTAGESIDLDGSDSEADDCKIAYYSWSLKNHDGLYDSIQTAYSTDPIYSLDLTEYDGPTTFDIKLYLRCRMISDESGSAYVEDAEDDGLLEVSNAEPTIDGITYDSPISEGDTVTIEASVTEPEPDDELHILWLFSDGESGEGENFTRTFLNDGQVALEIVAEDDDGGSSSLSYEFNIENLAPELSCMADDEVWVGETWTLTPEATDAGNDTLSWSIEPEPSTAWFDETTGEMEWEPEEDESGVHDFVLSAEDGDGGLGSCDFSVEVLSDVMPPDTGEVVKQTDSGSPSPGDDDSGSSSGAQITPSTTPENIGCSCSTGTGLLPWFSSIFLCAFAGLRRRH